MENKVRFKKRIIGYKPEMVDKFIENIMEHYKAGMAQNEELESECKKLASLNDGNKKRLREYAKKLEEWEIFGKRLQSENLKLREKMGAKSQKQAAEKSGALPKAEDVGQAQREAALILKNAKTELEKAYAAQYEIACRISESLKSIASAQGSAVLESVFVLRDLLSGQQKE